MKTFTLHLIRHGLTQGNIDRVFMGGRLDLPLCQRGVDDLEALARTYRYPGVGVVFSSPMQRALQTADILYPHMQNKIVVEDLRENCFGTFEGRSLDEMANDPQFTLWLDAGSDFRPEGGESGQEFAARIDRGFASMFRHMMEENVSEAACVTHGGVIMSLMARWALPKKSPAEWMSDNGCGFSLRTSAALLMRDKMAEAVAVVPDGYLSPNRPIRLPK